MENYENMVQQCNKRNNKCFFEPRITNKWNTSDHLLVVGINHWCVHYDDCEFYQDCIKNYNCHKYEETCPFRFSEVDGKEYSLRLSTYEAFDCYYDILRQLETDSDLENRVGLGAYGCLKEFMLYMEGEYDDASAAKQKEFWDGIAFYNYIQHFTSKPLTSTADGVTKELKICEEDDFVAFCSVLRELKPKFVVVFHRDIAQLLEAHKSEFDIQKIFFQKVGRLCMPTRSYTLFYCAPCAAHQKITDENILESMTHSRNGIKLLYERLKIERKQENNPKAALEELRNYISNGSSVNRQLFDNYLNYCIKNEYFVSNKEGYLVVTTKGLMDNTQFLRTIRLMCDKFGLCIPEKKKKGNIDIWDFVIKAFKKKKNTFDRQFIRQSLHQNPKMNDKAMLILKNAGILY